MLACPSGPGHWIKIVPGLREHELSRGPGFWFGLLAHLCVTWRRGWGGPEPFLGHSSLHCVLRNAGAPEGLGDGDRSQGRPGG